MHGKRDRKRSRSFLLQSLKALAFLVASGDPAATHERALLSRIRADAVGPSGVAPVATYCPSGEIERARILAVQLRGDCVDFLDVSFRYQPQTFPDPPNVDIDGHVDSVKTLVVIALLFSQDS